MAARNPAFEARDLQARGWLPEIATAGNVLIRPLPPELMWRLKEALQIAPFAPLEVGAAIDQAIREYVDGVVPE
jgi:hypothetical protein